MLHLYQIHFDYLHFILFIQIIKILTLILFNRINIVMFQFLEKFLNY